MFKTKLEYEDIEKIRLETELAELKHERSKGFKNECIGILYIIIGVLFFYITLCMCYLVFR